MPFEAEDVDGILIVTAPFMELDASTADDFKQTLAPIVSGHAKVAVDLSGVRFMDSAGLGAILSVCKTVRAGNGRFCVFGLTEAVKALFDLVRVHRLFAVHEDRETAVRADDDEGEARGPS
ncbi:MAG: STAS domain-containing protein [Armatimonadota bacterium]|nr:MAG: STAS domain-containing protein [Armatimonadota bacterium]